VIYVDAPVWKRATSKNPRQQYSHMVADSVEELMDFAVKINVKPHFLHRANILHYDINYEQYLSAKIFGAVEVSPREIVRRGREMK